jgi:hypothetical protein
VAFAGMIGEHWEGGAALALDQDQQRSPGRRQLARASQQAAARGYRNKKNLIAVIYLIAGRLHFSPTHTN